MFHFMPKKKTTPKSAAGRKPRVGAEPGKLVGFKASTEEREAIKQLAALHTGGDVSALIRLAIERFAAEAGKPSTPNRLSQQKRATARRSISRE